MPIRVTRRLKGGSQVDGFVVFREGFRGSVSFLLESRFPFTMICYNDGLRMAVDYKAFEAFPQSDPSLTSWGEGWIEPEYWAKNVGIELITEDGSISKIVLPRVRVLSARDNLLYPHLPSILGRDALAKFRVDVSRNGVRLFLRPRQRPHPARVKKPRCFLSHNSRDKQFARKVAVDLKKKGVDVWYDEWKVKPGDTIPGSIEEGLTKFNNFVLIMTPNSMSSRYVARELSVVLHMISSSRKRGQKRIRIIPVLARDCSIPLWLRDVKYVDFRRGNYSIAFRELRRALI
jgi:hypothetical protein